MTVRNISIVFSPTLGIPAGIFTLMLAEFSMIFVWGSHDVKRMPSKEKKSIPQEQIQNEIQEKIEASSTPNTPNLPKDSIEEKSVQEESFNEPSPLSVHVELPPEPESVLQPIRVMEQPLEALLREPSAKEKHRYSEVPVDMMKALAAQLKDLGNDDLYEGEEADPQMLEEMVKELM
jgi:hypothetical protein